ncbi:MAG: hypothetical protein QOE58_69 [Actinomycetota bacterium]|jgi:RNA polymerase sigma factor (sigma-70 family)|nr:hypothetical protein [Actinomycetota bacterium]
MNLELQPVGVLISAAVSGNQEAWNAIVNRYAAVVWSVCRQFRLSQADAADVSQTVWLRAVESLSSLREPAALPGWLATTTRRECIRATNTASRQPWSLEDQVHEPPADEESTALDVGLLEAERRAMVREALAELPAQCQRLLTMVFGEDPRPYAEISSRLSMPAGSIGPTRSRCLDKLRTCPTFVKWLRSQNIEERA